MGQRVGRRVAEMGLEKTLARQEDIDESSEGSFSLWTLLLLKKTGNDPPAPEEAEQEPLCPKEPSHSPWRLEQPWRGSCQLQGPEGRQSIPVTLISLYKVLQESRARSGFLPGECSKGRHSFLSLPLV
jgi:hypothetical protein